MFNFRNRLRQHPIDARNSKEGFELNAYGATDKGLKRGENEDSFLLMHLNNGPYNFTDSDLECVLAVADGLGHDKRGLIASQMAIETLRNSFFLTSVQSPMQRLVSGFEIANQRIFNQAEHDNFLRGMATTLTAVFVRDNIAYVAHLGNSRAYLIRDGQMMRLTKDQTLAETLFDAGEGVKHEIAKSAYKTLLQAVGNDQVVDIWQASVELAPEDHLLVCSDGLTSCLTELEIEQIVEKNAVNPELAVRRLIAKSNELGGNDNITAIVAQFRYVAGKNIPISLYESVENPLTLTAAA